MFVKSKSVPEIVDNVEHVIASLPVIVKLIDADDDVAAVRARVTVGALVSGKVVDVVVDVVSLLPELLLGAALVGVVALGDTTVVVVVDATVGGEVTRTVVVVTGATVVDETRRGATVVDETRRGATVVDDTRRGATVVDDTLC